MSDTEIVYLDPENPHAMWTTLDNEFSFREYRDMKAALGGDMDDPMMSAFAAGWIRLRRRDPNLSFEDAQDRVVVRRQSPAAAPVEPDPTNATS